MNRGNQDPSLRRWKWIERSGWKTVKGREVVIMIDRVRSKRITAKMTRWRRLEMKQKGREEKEITKIGFVFNFQTSRHQSCHLPFHFHCGGISPSALMVKQTRREEGDSNGSKTYHTRYHNVFKEGCVVWGLIWARDIRSNNCGDEGLTLACKGWWRKTAKRVYWVPPRRRKTKWRVDSFWML